MNSRSLTSAINKHFRFIIAVDDSYTLDYSPSPLSWTQFKKLVAANIKALEPFVNDYWTTDLVLPWQELDDAIQRLIESAKELNPDEDAQRLDQRVLDSFNILSSSVDEQETHTEIRFYLRSVCTSDKRFPEIEAFMTWASDRCAQNQDRCDSEIALSAFTRTVKEPSLLYYHLNSSSASEKLADLWALKKELSQGEKEEESASTLLNLSAAQLGHVQETLDTAGKDFLTTFSSLTTEMGDFRDEVIVWKESQKQEVEEWRAKQEAEIHNLERLYREKLALEEPKEVWEAAAKKHDCHALWWSLGALGVAALTLVGGSFAIYWLFTANLPEIPLLSSSFLAITIITFCVYTIRIFVKIAMSNSHLAAAYRQKAAMTYFYLSLVEKEKAVSDEERALILNSLFSSVDTGLVKTSDNKDLETLAAIAFKRA